MRMLTLAFTVQLRDENGNALAELCLSRLPVRAVPAPDDPTSPVLRFIDPFGDTMLNAAQAAALVAELRQALSRDDGDDESCRGLIELALRCVSGVHKYLWFIGD